MLYGKLPAVRKWALGAVCALGLLAVQPLAFAAETEPEFIENENGELVEVVKGKDSESGSRSHDDSPADGWFKRADDRMEADKSSKEGTEDENKKGKKQRYVKIIEEENGFAYYLDTQNARWLPLPHSNSEQIIDVWVKLVQVGETDSVTSRGTRPDSSYSYSDIYYLEHYYLRPNKQQIQFLCELEVTGRPQNAIEERRYSAAHWENLVPGSVEDDIYHAVMEELRRSKNFWQMTRHGKRITVRDAIEEYLRISL